MQNFDAIIIGAGQAGGPLAHRLADRDWKVALLERDHLGESCRMQCSRIRSWAESE